jgi:PiT family inorganic phosphate transporter
VIFGALIGALLWNVATWYYGIPSSSSHALIGGMIGSTVAKAGVAPLLMPGIVKTAVFIFLSPMIGFALGALIMILVSWIFFKASPRKVDKWFRRLQFLSSGSFSLMHGANDAQKTMGIIWLLLIAAGISSPSASRPPEWVIYSCFAAIGLGTLFGGWRIVKTMGQRITKLKPVGGFSAETGGAITLAMVTFFGIPVSTTHTITGSIVGVGSATRARAVHWGVAGNIVIAWVLTIPASGLMAAAGWQLGQYIFE